MEITFTADNCKIDIEKIKELTQNTNCKVIDLSPENGWEKIGEYLDHKYFVNRDATNVKYGQIIRELTNEEFNSFEYGFEIDGIVSVVGFGYSIYRNRQTKEEHRVQICLG
jgi:hypothetical protein